LKENFISLDKSCFRYGPSEILTDVSLTMKKNEIVSLLGRNGAGKTTLLKGIAQIIPPFSGDYSSCFDQISYFSDVLSLWEDLKVKDIQRLFKIRANLNSWWLYLENNLKIEELKNQLIKHLSFGQKKRVHLYFSLLNKPDFLICDEPFSNLDFCQKDVLIKFFIQIKKEVGIILSTHDFYSLNKYADRIYVIQDKNLLTIPRTKLDLIEEVIK